VAYQVQVMCDANLLDWILQPGRSW